ncbi:hypothetical protein TTHERM_00713450 (macronuclear) [Tetrahymena thermophila SB210]|uniref:Protein kinase domain-containing protein n=1 Tax=Tetrahymena thermophila (strain SB210) TaxID=312017 RepID=Q24CV7_TETTS|nr:hypothetical protein TTHERM_00713450 [Tetrahymena thermophila SB210]EAS05651.2 hypothetical protein TTHERM_00713450 [Tetrahymena thermophila SB210]|eukprot:XP_001025896.2 hypothetical protein TTHERM_00713450 [Tetrahymena thermophila SB210]
MKEQEKEDLGQETIPSQTSKAEGKSNKKADENDPWNQLLESEEPDKAKQQNSMTLESILDISNILAPNENQSKEDDETFKNDECIENNFIGEQQNKPKTKNGSFENQFDQKLDNDQTYNEASNQNQGEKKQQYQNYKQQIENSPLQLKKNLSGVQGQPNIGSYSFINSPLPQLQFSNKSASYKEQGYLHILRNQKGFLNHEGSLQSLENENQFELSLPSTKQNLDQNVYSFNIGIEQLTNLTNQNQRKALYDTMKTFLDSQQKVQIINNFEDIMYTSTGIQFNIASYRDGEKGMKVIVCHSQEMENKVNYIIDEESSLTEYCDLQLLEKITYIIDLQQNENESYLKKLIIIVTEKPKTSFKKFLRSKLENPQNFKEEQFKGCIRKLIKNVLFRHDSCIATKCLCPFKINCLFEHRIVVCDLGESIVEKNLNLREGDTFIYQDQNYNEALSVYMSPQEQDLIQKNSNQYYDPFKSEIYSLGKIILEICLIKYQKYLRKKYDNILQDLCEQQNTKKTTKEWIHSVLLDNDLSYKIAGELNDVVNEIIIGKANTQYYFKKGMLRKLRMSNILQSMLEPQEEKRISSIKLALLTQSEKLLIRNRIQDPYPIFFKGQMAPDGYQITYPIRKLIYEGEIDSNSEEKHRKGLIRRQLDQEQESRLILEYGQFHKGRVNGQVKMFIFQEHWKLEGQCYNNNIHGKNTISYKGSEVFKGYFSNFILDEWYDVDRSDPIIQSINADKPLLFQLDNYIQVIVNNQDNQIKCFNDKGFDSLIEFSSLYDSQSINTFKKIELFNCGSPNKLEQILKNITTFTYFKSENTFVNVNLLLQYQVRLQQIDISNSQYFTDDDVVSLVTNQVLQSQLKKLCLDYNSKITLKGLKELSINIANMPKLQYLSCKKICQINQTTEKVKLDDISKVFISLLTNAFHLFFVVLDYTPIKDYVLEKVFENKKQTQIKWQYLSLNGCDGITKEGLRDLFCCKQLTELKKLDLMYCPNQKFDLPSKNLKICPQILNIAYSSNATGNQLEKFISRNQIVASTLQQISMDAHVLDQKSKDSFKKLTNPPIIILCIKEVTKIHNVEICLDLLSQIKNSSLYFTSNKPIQQNEVNLVYSSSSKSQYAKKIKFNVWKDGEFISVLDSSSPSSSKVPSNQELVEDLNEDDTEQNPLLKKNKKQEYKKEATKLLGFFNYKQDETKYTVRIMTRIFKNANLLRLSHLDLSNICLDLKSLLMLTQNSYVKNIITLDLSSQHITDQIIQDFTLSPHFTSLQTFILKKNNITIKSINLLVQSENLKLKRIITDKQSLSEDDLFRIQNEDLSILKMKIFGFFKNIESNYSSPAQIRDISNKINICQIQIFNNNGDKYLYVIEGVKRDTKLNIYTLKKQDNSFSESLCISYCSRVFECMHKTTTNLTLNLNELNNSNQPAKLQFVQNFGLISSIKSLKLSFVKTKGINDLIIQAVQSCKSFQQLFDLTLDLSQMQLSPSEFETICINLRNIQRLEILSLHLNQIQHLKQLDWKFLSSLGESTKQLLNLQEANYSLQSCTNLTAESIGDMMKNMMYLKIQKLQLNLKQNQIKQEEYNHLNNLKSTNFIICDLYINI